MIQYRLGVRVRRIPVGQWASGALRALEVLPGWTLREVGTPRSAILHLFEAIFTGPLTDQNLVQSYRVAQPKYKTQQLSDCPITPMCPSTFASGGPI